MWLQHGLFGGQKFYCKPILRTDYCGVSAVLHCTLCELLLPPATARSTQHQFDANSNHYKFYFRPHFNCVLLRGFIRRHSCVLGLAGCSVCSELETAATRDAGWSVFCCSRSAGAHRDGIQPVSRDHGRRSRQTFQHQHHTKADPRRLKACSFSFCCDTNKLCSLPDAMFYCITNPRVWSLVFGPMSHSTLFYYTYM